MGLKQKFLEFFGEDVDDEEKTLIGSFLGANNTADLKEAIGKLRRNIWRK